MVISLKGPKKVRDSGKFAIAKLEIARQILPSEGLNAERTDVFVRDSVIFEIAHVRDSETLLYLFILIMLI